MVIALIRTNLHVIVLKNLDIGKAYWWFFEAH